VLDQAFREAANFKDEYVSTEHLLLGTAQLEGRSRTRGAGGHGRHARSDIAGADRCARTQRVTDQNPEGKFQALEKYGQDLTELARRGKLTR